MAWETPKTNWYGAANAQGEYEGDYFNVSDYNRIKGNILYLHELACKLFPAFDLPREMLEKTTSSYFFYSDFTSFIANARQINSNTFQLPFPTFSNISGMLVHVPTYNDWNALEQLLLDLYENMMNIKNHRRQFTWNFGMQGGDL